MVVVFALKFVLQVFHFGDDRSELLFQRIKFVTCVLTLSVSVEVVVALAMLTTARTTSVEISLVSAALVIPVRTTSRV
jgi:hypothetical protein